MAENQLTVFPAFFKVANQHVVIVGNGAEALAKARLVDETQADIVVISDTPTAGLSKWLAGSDAFHHPGPYRSELLDGAVLVFAATGDPDADRQIVADARAGHTGQRG